MPMTSRLSYFQNYGHMEVNLESNQNCCTLFGVERSVCRANTTLDSTPHSLAQKIASKSLYPRRYARDACAHAFAIGHCCTDTAMEPIIKSPATFENCERVKVKRRLISITRGRGDSAPALWSVWPCLGAS